MGNQQERFDLDLAWITGIIEGEGWVSLIFYKSNQKNGRFTPALKANIGATNCDMLIMDKFISILDHMAVKYRYNFRKAKVGSDGISRKAKVEISIENQGSLENFARAILPFMIGEKKNRVNHLLRFLEIRRSKPKAGPLAKYGKEEFLLYKEMYTYKGKSRSKILNDFTLDKIIADFGDKV